jgi:chromosome segregation ATPase
LRNSQVAMAAKTEDRISVFWRLFGGTLLSIAALVAITIYQQFTSSLGELRNNLNSLNESRGDLVKTDDFNTRMAALWTSLREVETTSAAVSALKERSDLMEQLLKQNEEERKELCRELQQLRERLVVLESRQAATPPPPAAPPAAHGR